MVSVGRYYLMKTNMIHNEAEHSCSSRFGGRLAVIETDAEYQLLNEYLLSTSSNRPIAIGNNSTDKGYWLHGPSTRMGKQKPFDI